MTGGDPLVERLAALRADVRSFLADVRAAGRFVPRCDSWIRGYDLDFSRELAARGWIGMTWPEDLGGGGASHLERFVVTEELLAAGAPVAAHWFADRQIGPALLRYGSRDLQEELLPGMARAEVTFAIGMSESEAGSDLAAVRTRAERTRDGWVLNGTKLWTSHAHRATHLYVLARTDRDGDRHEGLTEFVADLHADGVEVRPILDLQGEHHFNEVLLTDVHVPERWVLGEVGEGWRQVTAQLSLERGGPERFLSTYPLLEALVASLAGAGDPLALERIGNLAGRLMGLRRQAGGLARRMEQGEDTAVDAAALKVSGAEFERDVVAVARELRPDVPPDPQGTDFQRMLADAVLATPSFSLRGGASDILLGIVGRSMVSS